MNQADLPLPEKFRIWRHEVSQKAEGNIGLKTSDQLEVFKWSSSISNFSIQKGNSSIQQEIINLFCGEIGSEWLQLKLEGRVKCEAKNTNIEGASAY